MTADRDYDSGLLCTQVSGLAIRHLAALVALASESSSSAAARRLGRTQTTLNRHLTELEVAMGIVLVARAPGDARLTEGGRRMLPHAEAVLSRVETAREELAANLN
ncbi:MAG: LysR family transcriptional regulator [Gaiellaceae bacterium]